MSKISKRPGTMLYPLPAVLVSCGANPDEWTMLTISWTGIVCSDPAMCYISVRASRASYPVLLKNMEFTINLTTVDMVKEVDWAGMVSSRYFNKWEETGLVPLSGDKVKSPTIEQSPLSLECRIMSIIHLGSHDMLLSEIVNVRVDSRYINSATGNLELEKANLLAYSNGLYQSLGPVVGQKGFTVRGPQKDAV